MRRCKPRSRWLILLCAVFGLLTTSCGGSDGHEVVYLHVFNAYPGSQSMSLYGPTGAVVTDLPFGTRTDSPVAVDRNLGTEFELILDGAPTPFDLDQQLFNLYPQETATFLFSRRDDSTAQAQILRHIQSVSAGCRMVFHNSMAVANDQLGMFDFIVGWNFQGNITEAGYDEAEEDSFIAQHADDLSDDHLENHDDRKFELYDFIDTHPVFALATGLGTEGDEDPINLLHFVWLGIEELVDRPLVDFQSGSIRAHPPTEDYIECLEGALEAQEAIDQGADDPSLHDEANQNCAEMQTYTTETFGTGSEQVGGSLHYFPGSLPDNLQDGSPREPENECGADLRLYSDYGNTFGGEHGFENRPLFIDEFTGDVLTQEEDPLPRLFPRFGRSDHQFYVLYGRPAQGPEIRIEQWRASDQFEPMDDYP